MDGFYVALCGLAGLGVVGGIGITVCGIFTLGKSAGRRDAARDAEAYIEQEEIEVTYTMPSGRCMPVGDNLVDVVENGLPEEDERPLWNFSNN